jgi:hypothetical protein
MRGRKRYRFPAPHCADGRVRPLIRQPSADTFSRKGRRILLAAVVIANLEINPAQAEPQALQVLGGGGKPATRALSPSL